MPWSVDDPEDPGRLARYRLDREASAFVALYRSAAPRLRRFALRLAGGDHALADDLTQEAWMRAIGALDSFTGPSVTRWLCGILVNCWREQRRTTALFSGEEQRDTWAVDDHPPAVWSERPLLQLAIAALPDGYRAVLLLHDVEGYTHAEIGRMLHIAEGTSKSQLARARLRLRTALTARSRANVAADFGGGPGA